MKPELKKDLKRPDTEKTFLKKIVELDRTFPVFVVMEGPYLTPNGYPREFTSAENISERLAAKWHIVKRNEKSKPVKQADINNSHDPKVEPKTFATPNDFGDWADFTQRP